jgi:hypothetical protein
LIDLNSEVKIGTTDNRVTFFHISGFSIFPISNFLLAKEWLTNNKLTPESQIAMRLVIEKINTRSQEIP